MIRRVVEAAKNATQYLLYTDGFFYRVGTFLHITKKPAVIRYKKDGILLDIIIDATDGDLIPFVEILFTDEYPLSTIESCGSFVDFGSHIGLFSMYMMSRFPKSVGTGFEAEKKGVSYARQTCY